MADTIPIKQYGPFLHGLRIGAGLSQREVARRAGMSADTVRRLEAGDMRVRIDKILRFGQAVGSPLAYRFVPAASREERQDG